jgi:hypothetical protein
MLRIIPFTLLLKPGQSNRDQPMNLPMSKVSISFCALRSNILRNERIGVGPHDVRTTTQNHFACSSVSRLCKVEFQLHRIRPRTP